MSVKVRPRGRENIQQLLKRFRRVLEKEGVIRDMKKKSFYEKPSEIRNRVKRRAQREREKEKNNEKPLVG